MSFLTDGHYSLQVLKWMQQHNFPEPIMVSYYERSMAAPAIEADRLARMKAVTDRINRNNAATTLMDNSSLDPFGTKERRRNATKTDQLSIDDMFFRLKRMIKDHLNPPIRCEQNDETFLPSVSGHLGIKAPKGFLGKHILPKIDNLIQDEIEHGKTRTAQLKPLTEPKNEVAEKIEKEREEKVRNAHHEEPFALGTGVPYEKRESADHQEGVINLAAFKQARKMDSDDLDLEALGLERTDVQLNRSQGRRNAIPNIPTPPPPVSVEESFGPATITGEVAYKINCGLPLTAADFLEIERQSKQQQQPKPQSRRYQLFNGESRDRTAAPTAPPRVATSVPGLEDIGSITPRQFSNRVLERDDYETFPQGGFSEDDIAAAIRNSLQEPSGSVQTSVTAAHSVMTQPRPAPLKIPDDDLAAAIKNSLMETVRPGQTSVTAANSVKTQTRPAPLKIPDTEERIHLDLTALIEEDVDPELKEALQLSEELEKESEAQRNAAEIQKKLDSTQIKS